ncbi:rhamnan synthesis F family protein [Microbacterium kyungheense]
MPSYFDAVLKHEALFTEHFTERGYAVDVAYASADHGFTNASLLAADELLDAGCPLLRRRPFVEWPPFLDRHSVIGRWTLAKAERHGYPVQLVLRHLSRNVAPRDLNADAGLFDVLLDIDTSYDDSRPFRIVVTAHVFYEEMTDEILDLADTLPTAYDLVVTTPTAEKAEAIGRLIAERPARGDVEVRVVNNDGRDQSAFLIGCRDVLLSDRYDLVVKLHSKKTPQDGFNVGRHFKAQQFDNLLASPGYTANVLALFQREPGLGLVYPPMIHIGYPTMGRGWWSNKPGFEQLALALGIRVPLDDISPLAPYGSMYIARPEALRPLIEREWRYEEFGGVEAYRDGGLAHILERMPSYAAAELGYHTRTAATTEYTSISHTAFEFNFDELSATTPGYTYEQIRFIRRAGYVGQGRARDFLRMYLRLNHPGAEGRILGVFEPDRFLGRWGRRLRHPRATVAEALRRRRR